MSNFKILGDPHLGRSFVHGVPLHRRGEREEMVKAAFVESYATIPPGVDLHINMGDLFDKAIVPYDVILFAADVVNTAAKNNPNVLFVILKGNHDLFRDLERASAFDLFSKLVTQKNVQIVTEPTVVDQDVFFAYDPVTSAADLVEKMDLTGVTTAWGHWDTNGFGSDHNVIPTLQLAAKGIKKVYTGHVHKPETFKRDGVEVIVTGSMQPYAFGEQADNKIYVDLTLADLPTAGDLTNKVVRLTLGADEALEENIDCLQLVVRKESEEQDDTPAVTLGSFDMESLFRKAFTDAGVQPTITETLIGRFNDKRLSSVE